MKPLRHYQIREARKLLGFTQSELADALLMENHKGNSDRSVSRWENGRAPIPGPVSVALRLMLAAKGLAL